MTEQRIVLVVDDAEDCAATLDVALQAIPGLVVQYAPSAEAALAMLDRDSVSAVITDVQLPSMTGLELVGRIRGQDRYGGMPILVMSADTDPRMPGNAIQSGANAFFAKPFSPAAIRKKLEELFHAV